MDVRPVFENVRKSMCLYVLTHDWEKGGRG